MHDRLAALLLALAAVGFTACGEDTTTQPAEEQEEPAAGVKTDCPDCDPAGPGAFEQTGVGDRFYAEGDHWQVAFRYVHEPMAEKRGDVFLGEDVADSEVFLFDYRVLRTDRDAFGDVLRDTATVEITQATPDGPHADLFSPERIDRFEHKVVFRLNDLLEPIAETIYDRNHPHGKRVRLDGESSLGAGASLYPRTIPRLLVEGAVDAPAPDLPVDLADVADAMDPAWRDATYQKYVFDNGDVVYWPRGRGHLWPFFVRTSQGAGVLVSWNDQAAGGGR
ncbi:MAG: hypothetical protein ACQEXJ_00745 [Myxococcota bacterium]